MSSTQNVCYLLSGIGGFDLACERAGFDIALQCEIDSFCAGILKEHWPNVPLLRDIKDVPPQDIPDATLWCAGFPCQDLSLANQGKRKGLEGSRSGLFYQLMELVREKRPRWLLLENVPGLLNAHKGEDFRTVLESLDQCGYGVAWRVLDAKYFGTPQRRRRTYVVGSLGTVGACEVLFDSSGAPFAPRQGLGEGRPPAGRTGESVSAANFYSIQHACIGRKASAGPQGKGWRNDGETWTLDSRGIADAVCSVSHPLRSGDSSGLPQGMDGAGEAIGGRANSPSPQTRFLKGESKRYRAIGNAVCVNVVSRLVERIALCDAKYYPPQATEE